MLWYQIVVAPIAYPVQSEKKASVVSDKRRSSADLNVTQNTDLETFDYDTSDSIDEEDEENESGEDDVFQPGNESVKSSRSRRSDNEDVEVEDNPKKGLNRPSRRSIGGRYSNITMESTLGGETSWKFTPYSAFWK